jgi:hypothetical protein
MGMKFIFIVSCTEFGRQFEDEHYTVICNNKQQARTKFNKEYDDYLNNLGDCNISVIDYYSTYRSPEQIKNNEASEWAINLRKKSFGTNQDFS